VESRNHLKKRTARQGSYGGGETEKPDQ